MTAVEALKDKARRAYLRYYHAHPDATCGNALLQHISPEGDARAGEAGPGLPRVAAADREELSNCPTPTTIT